MPVITGCVWGVYKMRLFCGLLAAFLTLGYGVLHTNDPHAPPKRVALCFFGLLKNTSRADVNNYRSMILEPLQSAGYEVDGFLHTYHVRDYANARNREKASNISPQESLLHWKELTEFRFIEISDPQEADIHFCPISKYLRNGDPWPSNPIVSVIYYLRQLYSISRITDALLARRRDYVGAIYLRPDVRFLDRLDVAHFRNLTESPGRRIAVPQWQSYGGLNDRFAAGNVDSMIRYGKRMSKINEYLDAGYVPHAERYLAHYLKTEHFAVDLIPIRFQRLRADGTTETRDAKLDKKKRKRRRDKWGGAFQFFQE